MAPSKTIRHIPWDSDALGINAYEINNINEKSLNEAVSQSGHYTIRINPLSSKKLLNDYGFYYVDTLIEPFCTADKFTGFTDKNVTIASEIEFKDILEICDGAFSHDRFHRDFNIKKADADKRYNHWLKQLYLENKVYGIQYQKNMAAFIAIIDNQLVLHAVADKFRGKGLAKQLWTTICKRLFEMNHKEITSSISATNLAVTNLYSSLGFNFRNPVDIYHCLIK
jgi:RimJ/RimL family protein N-acetyltransferase